MEQDIIFLASNTIVGNGPAGGVTTTETAQAAPVPAQEEQAPANSLFGGGSMQLLITMAAVFAIMYFFTIRPQKKREAQIKEMQNSIKPGDWVATFSGLYGKVVDVGEEIMMVEFGTNKSVIIPIKKSELTKSTEPSLLARKDDSSSEK